MSIPVLNNQFIAGASTYTVNVPIAYVNAAGPYWPMVNGRFIVPQRRSAVERRVHGARRQRRSRATSSPTDDEFSVDGNVVYTVNAVNVVKATNQATLGGRRAESDAHRGRAHLHARRGQGQRERSAAGVTYNTGTQQFTATVNGDAGDVHRRRDHAPPTTASPRTHSRSRRPASQLTFTDSASGVTFTFDSGGNNPVTARSRTRTISSSTRITGVTYYIDEADNRVEAISLPAGDDAVRVHCRPTARRT